MESVWPLRVCKVAPVLYALNIGSILPDIVLAVLSCDIDGTSSLLGEHATVLQSSDFLVDNRLYRPRSRGTNPDYGVASLLPDTGPISLITLIIPYSSDQHNQPHKVQCPPLNPIAIQRVSASRKRYVPESPDFSVYCSCQFDEEKGQHVSIKPC